jgi:hypothetical protein
MPSAIVFRYGRPWAGREKLSFEAFQDALSFFGKLATDGRCHEPITFMSVTGGGMMIVHGEREHLREILEMEEFARIYFKAGYGVPDLSYEVMAAGESAVEQMGLWASTGSELGFFD